VASEGWDWLREMPPSWQVPEILSTPTASGHFNLGLLIIGSNIGSNELVVAVADFIAAKARLEIWMGEVEPRLTFREQFAIGRVASEALRVAYEAWVAFEAAHRASGGKALPVEDYEVLRRSVSDGTAILVQARSRPGD
jgi:hypothetical protein